MQAGLQAPLGLHWALPAGLHVQLELYSDLPRVSQIHAGGGAEGEEQSEGSEHEIRSDSS